MPERGAQMISNLKEKQKMGKSKDAAIGRMNQALKHIEALARLLDAGESAAEREFITGRLRSLVPDTGAKGSGVSTHLLSAS